MRAFQSQEVRSLAFIAIGLYPIGLWLLSALLLACAHKAIIRQLPTPFAVAIASLHQPYQPVYYAFWWELVEMLRRFLLVRLNVSQ